MNAFWFPKTGFHDPDYVPFVQPFETTEELLQILKYKHNTQPEAQFALSDDYVMLVLKDGFEWWVAGKVRYPKTVNLPKWEGAKYHALVNGVERVVTHVKSICGDLITLGNGSTATRIR